METEEPDDSYPATDPRHSRNAAAVKKGSNYKAKKLAFSKARQQERGDLMVLNEANEPEEEEDTYDEIIRMR